MSESSPSPASRRAVLLGGGAIVMAAFAAYHNSFTGPFIFDDTGAITDNPSIRHLWPIGAVLFPPPGMTVSGRPLLNLTLALNHALGGTAVRGYHALNLVIQILAGLTLFGVMRRTLRLGSGSVLSEVDGQALRPRSGQALRARLAAAATPLGLAVALLWTVHPLQTESVTYVVQRAESLVGLCYLLTLYCFIRGTGSPAPGRWQLLAIVACLLGMAAKEVMVSAPLLVLLYDRTFVAGTFSGAWRQRRRLYLGLAATWLLLGCLLLGTGGTRSGSAGFGVGIAWWAYALTQFRSVAHYLWLAGWPHPLILDYGPSLARRAAETVPYALVLVPLVAGTVIALRRRPAAGFVGAWFFVILAPSSSVVPVADTMFEHRIYLSLAAVIAAGGLGLFTLAGRRSLIALPVLAAGLGLLTAQRNENYRSEIALWSDTVAKRPDNARAYNNLGNALDQAGRGPEAIIRYEQALRIKPDYARAHDNLGVALVHAGRTAEAIPHAEAAVRLKPAEAGMRYNLGVALDQAGRGPEAMACYEETLRLQPDHAGAHNNLGLALAQAGRPAEAIRHFEAAIRLTPAAVEAHCNLGNILLQTGRLPEAIRQFEAALRLRPDAAAAHNNLGLALAKTGRLAEALPHYAEALRLQPGSAETHNNLGLALVQAGRLPEALAQYQEALRAQPALAEARYNLGNVLLALHREKEAVTEYEATLRLKPDYAEAHNNLGSALLQTGRGAEAMQQYEEALRLKPDYADARDNLARLRSLPQR